MIDLGFGLQPIVQIVVIGIAALDIAMIRGLADHAVPQIRVNRILRALCKGLVGCVVDLVPGIENRHHVRMLGIEFAAMAPHASWLR